MYDEGVRISDSDGSVTLTIHDIETGEYITSSDGDAIAETSDGNGDPIYSYLLGFDDTAGCRKLKAVWDFGTSDGVGKRTDYIEVVMPLVTPDEIQEEFPQFAPGGDEAKTFDELKRMERTVRGIVTAYTNQVFTCELNKVRKVVGTDADALFLKYPIFNLHRVVQGDTLLYGWKTLDSDGNAVESDGFVELLRFDEDFDEVVRRKVVRGSVFDVKADVTDTALRRGPIFKSGYIYSVTADWGFEYIPNGVNQAAKLLVRDYFCADGKYHEMGVNIVRSADWRMEFAHDPYSTTGNVYADQLLSRYVNINVGVI